MSRAIKIEHQIIYQGDKPAFAVVPYPQFLELMARAEECQRSGNERVTIPHDVMVAHLQGGVSLVKAWREYLDLTQEEVASRAGMSQPAIVKLESPQARPRRTTLAKLAKAMGLQLEQLGI